MVPVKSHAPLIIIIYWMKEINSTLKSDVAVRRVNGLIFFSYFLLELFHKCKYQFICTLKSEGSGISIQQLIVTCCTLYLIQTQITRLICFNNNYIKSYLSSSTNRILAKKRKILLKFE